MDAAEGSLIVVLEGPAAQQGSIAVGDLPYLTSPIQSCVRRLALKLAGRSLPEGGRTPGEVERLIRLELRGLRAGSTVLELRFSEGGRPLPGMDLGPRAVELMIEGLRALQNRQPLPDEWDDATVRTLRGTEVLFHRGFDSISLSADGGGAKATINRDVLSRMREYLTEKLQAAQTIQGQLLMVDLGKRPYRCRIYALPGEKRPALTCTFEEELAPIVLQFLAQPVRIVAERVRASQRREAPELRIAHIELLNQIREEAGPNKSDFWNNPTPEELARGSNVRPVKDVRALKAEIWHSDEEISEFLRDVYRYRKTDRI